MPQRTEWTPPPGNAFVLAFTLLAFTFLGGGYLDGWAHLKFGSALETFFTPWHAVRYGGMLATGLLSDLALAAIGDRIVDTRWLRVFAFTLPALVLLAYFTTLFATSGVWWTVHFWAGSIVVAGLVGLLASCAVRPPAAVSIGR